jgi:uncharacterized glyoxalase superfamily protein PhnB
MNTNYKPATHPFVVPYLVVSDADKELAFMKEVLGAREVRLSRDPQGKVGHGELGIGDSMIMLGQASEQWPPSPAAIYVYVPDVDLVFKRAVAAGAASIWPPVDQPYGDRNAGVLDSNGVQWWLATHIEDVSKEESERRKEAAKNAVTVSV